MPLHFRFSIFAKLLMVMLPLVCLPAILVGWYSIRAAGERVDRLVRQEQMVKVEASARRIDEIFQTCRIDLETITRLPVLEDFQLARAFRLTAEARFNQDSLVRLWRDLLGRTPHYFQIHLFDATGLELIKVGRQGEEKLSPEPNVEPYFKSASMKGAGEYHFSRMLDSPERGGYIMHCSLPFHSRWGELAGVLVIDLDFETIIQIIRDIQVGESGYSFMVDNQGRTLVHPRFAPYTYDLNNYDPPSLLNLVLDMMAGNTGWQTYSFEGVEKLAALAPIPVMKWSIAVTVSLGEMGKEAQEIRTRVIQVVLFTLLCTLAMAALLSYHILRPVRRLAEATSRIAQGELEQEIPARSGDELGDLTRSFNHMVANLKRVQMELVRSEKLIGLGRLSAGVAHEIRNPLNAMKGAMAHLRQRLGHEPLVREYATLVSEEVDRLNRFVSDFLYFARQTHSRPRQVDLNRLILEIEDLLGQGDDAIGMVFHNQLDPSLPFVRVDPDQLERVFWNLFRNAMDAMPEGGVITTTSRLAEDNGRVWVTVVMEDEGPGIPEEDFAYVFDPFFTSKDTGTGLGLPISLAIVEEHGGLLTLENLSAGGVRAVLKLPV